jgi:hypothetical protein
MKKPRQAKPFWRRRIPPRNCDIALLRPPSLDKSQRFETEADARAESLRSEKALKRTGRAGLPQQYLCECRADHYHCEKSYCPLCARQFRRWFIAEVLRFVEQSPCNAQIVTALLAGSSNIEDLNPAEHRHLLRKRLDRAGLSNVPCIGGFEIVYRDRAKQWVLHVNLLILGGTKRALDKFEASFSSSELFRPGQIDPLRDRAKQISYLLKFTTYHRPLRQTGAKKSPARPLNVREHVKLVDWMARYSFSDMMFLYGVRRKGDRLVTNRRWRG